jgi:ABC-type amino acid transport substrate-binding protein
MPGAVCAASSAPADPTAGRDGSTRPLVVAIVDSPPFAFKDSDGTWAGLSVELWREVAADRGWRWEARQIDLEQVDAVLGDGTADAAVGSVAIDTTGAMSHDYSVPYLATGLGFAQPASDDLSWYAALAALAHSELLKLAALIAAALVLVGVSIAVLERGRNAEQFGGPLRQGIATGVWWAAVTMTTVGYGDATPKTASGRSLALVWMFVGVVAVAIFTATVTSMLTVGSLHGAVQQRADLFHLRLGAIGGSAGAEFLTQHGVGFTAFDSYEAALTSLAHRRVDAVVANRPALRYLVSGHWQGTLRVSEIILEPISYAIGLPLGSPLRIPMNRAILGIIEQNRWRDVEQQYLGHS